MKNISSVEHETVHGGVIFEGAAGPTILIKTPYLPTGYPPGRRTFWGTRR
jgi:hypothetical protein